MSEKMHNVHHAAKRKFHAAGQAIQQRKNRFNFVHEHAALQEEIDLARQAGNKTKVNKLMKEVKNMKNDIRKYTMSYNKTHPDSSVEKSNLLKEANAMLKKLEELEQKRT